MSALLMLTLAPALDLAKLTRVFSELGVRKASKCWGLIAESWIEPMISTREIYPAKVEVGMI